MKQYSTEPDYPALIAECRRILDGYPEKCPERVKIDRQIEELERKEKG